MIEVHDLTKRFGSKVAVNHLSFTVRPGVVTGFLGPNGSGKSTTMRCMIGLDRPDTGTTTFNGAAFRTLDRPLTEVGALFDAGYVHPGRSARNHLRWLAASNGLPVGRVDEMLQLVGLSEVAKAQTKTYSLGMRQRLGLAGALLGDPHTLMLDEPANGLDPEGVRWIREVLIAFARHGRSVLVSSHLLSEMALMADDLIVLGQGRLLEQGSVSEFIDRFAERWVRVVSPNIGELLEAVARAGGQVNRVDERTAELRQIRADQVGDLAAERRIVIHELSPQTGSLEDAYLRATAGTEEYVAGTTPAPTSAAGHGDRLSQPPSLPPPPPTGFAPPSGGGR